VPFERVIEAAREARERLESLGLVAFCKTTGGKGLHVVTPLAAPGGRGADWKSAKEFAHAVCAQMAADSPERYVVNMSKKARAGRIFLDYLRNGEKATAVAPLSPRAREGATVSMPLAWSQVKRGLDPARFTIRTATKLLAKGRAWNDYDRSARPLPREFLRRR
jgi:bifunctional non-homologous end joining protein LigD